MRITCVLFGLWLLVVYVHCSPVEKREAESEDLSPLNEVYIVEADDDQAADGDRGDRDKRKIGVLKLGVSNGIINFVFSKLDSFIDSKTKALIALEDANKVKNAAYGIDAKHSATGKFISDLVAAKIQAASGSIGPVIHSAQTLIAGTKSGLADAVVSKLAPLSSIATGVSAGLAGKLEHGGHGGLSGHGGHGVDLGVSHDSSGVSGTVGVLGNLLNSLSELSHKGAGASGPSGHAHDAPTVGHPGAYASLGAGYEYDPPQREYYTA